MARREAAADEAAARIAADRAQLDAASRQFEQQAAARSAALDRKILAAAGDRPDKVRPITTAEFEAAHYAQPVSVS